VRGAILGQHPHEVKRLRIVLCAPQLPLAIPWNMRMTAANSPVYQKRCPEQQRHWLH